MEVSALKMVSSCTLYLIGLSCLITTSLAEDICQPGDLMVLPNAPCKTCVCGANYLPTDECTTVPCSPPTCPAGTVLTYDPEKCCEYNCITVEKECISGLAYLPPGIGCGGCDCVGGYRNNCVEYMAKCHWPECGPGEITRQTPGQCCGFYCTVPGAKNPSCNHPIRRGCPVGHSYMKTWGYNTDTGRCELYVAGDCKGLYHENSFDTQQICEDQCSGFVYTQPENLTNERSWLPVIIGSTVGVVVLVALVVMGVVLYYKNTRAKRKTTGEDPQDIKPVKL